MSSEQELDEGIKSIKSAWRREHTARANLEKMLENIEAENAKLRELCGEMLLYIAYPYVCVRPSVLVERARELGVEVDDD